MSYLLICFFLSFLISLLIIRYQHLHSHFSSDQTNGPQKFHNHQVPRIGGVAIFLALFFSTLIRNFTSVSATEIISFLIFVSLPTFGVGLLEDLTKKIGVKVRLIFTSVAALLFIYLFHSRVTRIDIQVVDHLLLLPWIAIPFTCFAIAGVANAYNIIDGFNGLASMVGIIALTAIGWIGFKVGDVEIAQTSLMMIGAIAGFFIWNYPKGLIFLGDGGAYLIGFYVATCSILLVSKHPEVSAWFALLVNAYPITETLFTIWRRFVHQGKNPGLPDAAHFHSLIYRRVVRWAELSDSKNTQNGFMRNAKTSPYLWLLSSIGVIPAIVFWNNTITLQICCVMYCLLYVYLYQSIVRFRFLRLPPFK